MVGGRIEIPYNEAGKRCVDAFLRVAEKLLQRARVATRIAVDDVFTGAKQVDEIALKNGRYTAVFASPYGEHIKIVYDYRSKKVMFERMEVAA